MGTEGQRPCVIRSPGHSERADTHGPQGSLFWARGTVLRMFLRERGKELVWVSSLVCALDGGKSSLLDRNRFLQRVAHSPFSFFPLCCSNHPQRNSQYGWHHQLASRPRAAPARGSAQAASDGRMRASRSTRRGHVAARQKF